jgi:glycosyltransferase involved in cell wall biosynthesis
MSLVSVVMPVYNAGEYLHQAIESVLAQTLQDFELICIDDGSTDGSLEVLQAYASRDARILVLQNERNLGEPATRNTGMSVARGEYIAIQDADDVSLPQRLERQVEFLQATPSISVLGAAMLVVDEHGVASRHWPAFETDVILRCLLLVMNPLAHPSVVLRRRVIQEIGGYQESLTAAVDYELWVRAASVCKFANMPEVLVRYRQHSMQATYQNIALRSKRAEISLHALDTLAKETALTFREIQAMSDLASGYWHELNPEDVVQAGEMLWPIINRCLIQWGGTPEEECVLRQWLSGRMVRVAGSLLRAGKRDAVRVCLPSALQIAPQNRMGIEELWLRLQGVVGPRIARHLKQFVGVARRPFIGRTTIVSDEKSWKK